ncbi:MAG TPA: hypothetical protein VLK82_23485 [Candidatus Tectomicrobia bacterium]|nr:hypothetical protein [Candidatus Tectomicrobia bacterium]
MNARPNPRIRPSGKRAWIAVALVSASAGALIAILAISILGPRLADVAQVIGPRMPMVTESSQAIMRWYRQFDGDDAAQAAASTQYYNRYVAWELSFDEVEPVGSYARTVTEYAGTGPDDPPHAIWAFFTDPGDVAQLREHETVAVRGKIVFINAGNIFLGDCQLTDS